MPDWWQALTPHQESLVKTINQRGLSISVMVCLLIPVLLLCIGLAVDGARKAAANRQAEAVAAQAARAGVDAAAPYLVIGGDGRDAAQQAARAVVDAHPGVEAEISVEEGTLQISTEIPTSTVFIGLAGIDELVGRGTAEVELQER